jgi:hypothetical protein
MVESIPGVPRAPESYTAYPKDAYPKGEDVDATYVHPDAVGGQGFPEVSVTQDELDARTLGRGIGILAQMYGGPTLGRLIDRNPKVVLDEAIKLGAIKDVKWGFPKDAAIKTKYGNIIPIELAEKTHGTLAGFHDKSKMVYLSKALKKSPTKELKVALHHEAGHGMYERLSRETQLTLETLSRNKKYLDIVREESTRHEGGLPVGSRSWGNPKEFTAEIWSLYKTGSKDKTIQTLGDMIADENKFFNQVRKLPKKE